MDYDRHVVGVLRGLVGHVVAQLSLNPRAVALDTPHDDGVIPHTLIPADNLKSSWWLLRNDRVDGSAGCKECGGA